MKEQLKKIKMKNPIKIVGILPSLNKIISSAKNHYGRYAKAKKEWTSKVAVQVKTSKKITGKNNYCLRWFCKDRRTDPDNLSAAVKYVFDGLQKAKKIDGDGWKQIGSIHHFFYIDKKNPRVELTHYCFGDIDPLLLESLTTAFNLKEIPPDVQEFILNYIKNNYLNK